MSYYDYNSRCGFTELIGKTLKSVNNLDDTEIEFVTDQGEIYKLYHSQDCCESVIVEDIIGDLEDIIGSPILSAEESCSSEDPEGYKRKYQPESCTWTFYRIATIKGYVTIRWFGESNGYYSEGVDFVKIQ